eukprot:scaffold4841_cov259-Ochromonas_danica.AAC.19
MQHDERASMLRDPDIEWVAVKIPSTGGEDGGIVMGNTVTGGDIETLSLPPVTSPPLFLSTSHPSIFRAILSKEAHPWNEMKLSPEETCNSNLLRFT